jgi:hypothetical protein
MWPTLSCSTKTNTGRCRRCELWMFAPRLNPRKNYEYLRALETLQDSSKMSEHSAAAAAVLRLALKRCQPCREYGKKSSNKPTTAAGRTKVEWARLKREVFCLCKRCGADRAIEADHVDPTQKLHRLSDPAWWARHGGVQALRQEAAKCQPICRMCHNLEPTSITSNDRRCNPGAIKRDGFATAKRFSIAVLNAQYCHKKRAYNDELKRAVGRCENPMCPCDGPSAGKCMAGFEQCYDWDHIDESKKLTNMSRLCGDRKSFETAKPLIDAERAKCRLFCRNCHITRKVWETGGSR